MARSHGSEMNADLYSALGVDRGAPIDLIKRAFRREAKKAHPDAGGNREQFSLICLAKDVLTDEDRRKKYDRTGKIDETAPDQTESHAMQVVTQTIQGVIQTIESRGARFETFNIPGDAVKRIKDAISQMNKVSEQMKAEAGKQRRIAKRFKAKKGKSNKIAPMFENNARMYDEQSIAALRDAPSHELAIKILQDHDFDIETYDIPPLPPSKFSVWT